MDSIKQSAAPAWGARLLQYIKSPACWGYALAIIACVIIAFAFFYPDASEGAQLRQYDMLQGQAIGHEAKVYEAQTGEPQRWTNSIFSGMPTFQISPSYPSNELFAWITTVYGCGLPSPSNLLCMMMIGFLILMMALRVKPIYGLMGAIAWGFSTYFVIIIGAGHIWKFVTLAYVPPTLAGVVLAYRGRYLAGGALAALAAMMQIASNHVQMSYYFMMVIVALVIAYLVMAWRRKQMARWGVATATLAVAALLAVAANMPSLYNTYEYSKLTMRGSHSELTSADSSNTTAGLDRDYITQYSYGGSETFSLFIPNIKGGASVKPTAGQHTQLTLSRLPEAQERIASGKYDQLTAQYLDYVTQYFGEPEGTNGPVYVGVIIFALFVLGCVVVRGPVKWALLALTLLSVGLALGRNFQALTDLFIDYVPMYSKFRTVESILVIAEFTIPLLAILGLQRVLTDKNPRRYMKAVAWSFGSVMFFCLLGVVMPSVYGSVINVTDTETSKMIAQALVSQGYPAEAVRQFSLDNPMIVGAIQELRYGMIESDSLRSFLFAGLAAIAILAFMRGKHASWLKPATVAATVALLVLIDLYSVNKRYLDHDSFCSPEMSVTDPFAPTAIDRAILADTTSHYRVMNMPAFWSPSPSYHHRTIGGYHAAKLTRYQDLIDRHIGNFLNGSATEADLRVLNMLNAKYFVTPDYQVITNDAAYGNAWFVDSLVYVKGADAEMDALGAIEPRLTAVADESFRATLGDATPSAESDTIRLTSYTPDRLTYHSSSARGGVGVFSEVYFPWGWTATIDGEPVNIGRVDYVLRALPIPAGDHTIEMTFNPQSLHTTGIVATVAIILVYLSVLCAIAYGLSRVGIVTDNSKE